MIMDRYARPAKIQLKVSTLILRELDWILDDPYMFTLVRRDIAKHYKTSRQGCRPVSVEVTLQMSSCASARNDQIAKSNRKCATMNAIGGGSVSTRNRCRIIPPWWRSRSEAMRELLRKDGERYPQCALVDRLMFALGRMWGSIWDRATRRRE
jgi:hypothetical protein